VARGHRVLWTVLLGVLPVIGGALDSSAVELRPGDLVLVRQGDGLLHLDVASDALTHIPVPGLAAQAGLVLAPDGTVVFPAVATDPEAASVRIVRFHPLTGAVTTVSADGLLGVAAYDIAIARDGQLYVAAGATGVVAVDPATGGQALLAAPPAIPAPLAIATDETDRLWVAAFAPDVAGLEIAEVDRSTGAVLASFAVAECAQPRNGRLMEARAGELFLACSGTATLPDAPLEARVIAADGSTGSASVLASGELLEDPYGLAVEPDGDLLVVGSGRLVHVDGSSGAQTLVRELDATDVAIVRAACEDGFDNDGDGDGDHPADPECTEPLDLAETVNPCGDRVDNDGDGWIDHPADAGCPDVRGTTEQPSCDDGLDNDADGDVDLADPDCASAAARLERPLAPGDVLVVDAGARALVRVDPGSGLQESLGEIGRLEAPTGLAVDVDRSVVIADPGAGAVLRIDAAGGQAEVLPAAAGLQPVDVAIEPLGDYLVSDAAGQALFRIDRSTGIETIVALQAAPPGALALDGADLLVAEPTQDRVQRVDTGGGVQATETPALDPRGLALGADGLLWIAEGPPGDLWRWDPALQQATTVATGLGSLGGLALDEAGDAYASVAGSAAVVVVPEATGVPATITSGGRLVNPRGLAIVRSACNDGLDGDGDGLWDYPSDPGCDDPGDDDEHSPALPCDDGLDGDGDGRADFPDDPGCDDPLDPSERSPALVCDDGLDNDGDGFGDHGFDPGCDDPTDPLETSPLLACDDGEDDDGDGFVDYPGDPGCAGPASPVEDPDCDDLRDDDEDGLADYPDDPGCDSRADDSERSDALVCDDGVDNDGDKLDDVVEDPGCVDHYDASEKEAGLACDDGLDQDGDGQADFPDDAGCLSALDPDELEASIGCDDGLDGDGDGLVDHPDDPGCDSRSDLSERSPLLVCDDGADNDGDGLLDHPADPGCADPGWPVEAGACADGVDNDGDGEADFPLDLGCASAWDLSEYDDQPACSNGLDDDGDGLADDGADPGCDGPQDPSEHSLALVCDDGLDQDGDGRRDFPGDPGCQGLYDESEAEPGGATACDDGLDNDGDGRVDHPDDPGCRDLDDDDERSPDLPCDDGLDNDGDGDGDHPAESACAAPELAGEWAPDDVDPPLLLQVAAVGATGAAVVHVWTDEPSQVRLLAEVGTSPSSLEWRRHHVLRIEGLACGSPAAFDVVAWDPGSRVAIRRDLAAASLPCGSAEGLMAHWRLDEGSGYAVLDEAGAYPGLARKGAWRVADGALDHDHAIALDGVDDLVEIGAVGLQTDAVSFAVWAKALSFLPPLHDGRLLSRATSTQEKHHDWMLSTLLDEPSGETRLRLRLRIDGKTRTLIADQGEVPLGRWFHVVGLWDGSAMRLYLDGLRVGERLEDGPLDPLAPDVLAFGNQPEGAGDKPFHGRIDDVRIYARALSEAEIAGLFGGQQPLPAELSTIRASDALTVAWSTDLPSSARIRYRPVGAPAFTEVGRDERTTVHEAVLQGLAPGTAYEIEVESRPESGPPVVQAIVRSTLLASEIPALPRPIGAFAAALLLLLGATRVRGGRPGGPTR